MIVCLPQCRVEQHFATRGKRACADSGIVDSATCRQSRRESVARGYRSDGSMHTEVDSADLRRNRVRSHLKTYAFMYLCS